MMSACDQLTLLSDFLPLEEKQNGDAFFINGRWSRLIISTHMDSARENLHNHMLTTIRGAVNWVYADAPDDIIALLENHLHSWQMPCHC